MSTRFSNLNGRGSASGHELTSPDGDVFARRKALGEMPKAALKERLKWAASLNPHFIPISVIVRSYRTSVNATRHCARRRNRTHPPTVTPRSLKSRCRYRTEILCAWAIIEGDKSGSSSLFSTNARMRSNKLVWGFPSSDSLFFVSAAPSISSVTSTATSPGYSSLVSTVSARVLRQAPRSLDRFVPALK
jgi:hypothetical protein